MTGQRDDARWRVLAPFLAPLRGLLSLDVRIREGHVQSDCAGLVLALPVESSDEELRRLRAALDLLHALWRVDPRAWRRAVAKGVGVRIPNSIVLLDPEVETPSVVVSLKHDKFAWQVDDDRWRGLLCPCVQLSEAEYNAKRSLLASYAGQKAAMDRKPVPLRLQFLVFGMATIEVEAYLANVIAMVTAVHDDQQPADFSVDASDCTCFDLQSVELDISPYEISSGIARQLRSLHALGLPIHQLNLRLCEIDSAGEHMPPSEMDELMITLVPPFVREAFGVAPTDFTLETLVATRADLAQFESLCSAIQRTHAVKNLQLQNVFTFDTPVERHLKWQWLARALFLPESSTSIKHLSINQTEFEINDVSAVYSALGGSTSSVAADLPERYHALDTLAIASEASQAESVESISLLIAQIGQSLRCLSIYLWMGALNSLSLRLSLSSCPNLVFLDLSSVEIDSMDMFLDAYEHHACQIRSLAFHNVEIPNASVTAFALALTNSQKRAAHVVRELCLDSVGEGNVLDRSSLDAFLTVLETNSKIEYLELRIETPLLSEYRPRFQLHHQSWGPGVAELLPMACKIAFLSVCRPHQNDGRSAAATVETSVHRLDDRVLSTVFAFAAARVRRSIYVDEP